MTNNSRVAAWLLAVLAIVVVAGLTYADERIYVDAAVGRTMLDDELAGFPIEDDASGFRVGVGYDFDNNFALEIGYQSLGELEDAADLQGFVAQGEVDGFSAAGRFTLPITDNFSASAKAGMFFWDAELSAPGFVSIDQGEDLFYGIGLGFEFSDQLSFNAEWDRFEFDELEADVLWAGLNFRF